MPEDWSSRIIERFRVALPADGAAWLDEELWRTAEVSLALGVPVVPAELLDPGSHRIWGGQMLPDTLPLFDLNGDAVCLRFGEDAGVTEVGLWQHESGNWRPYSPTLSGTIMYAVTLDEAEVAPRAEPSARPWWKLWGRAPAASAESKRVSASEWALKWVRDEAPALSDFLRALAAGDAAGAGGALLRSGVAEVALRRDACEACCASGLAAACREIGGHRLAERIGAAWPELRTWMLDTARVPEAVRARLASVCRIPAEELLRQDWDGAAQEAQQVTELRQDLAWPYSVLGYAAERRGDLAAASDLYFQGLRALGSTQDFTEAWLETGSFQSPQFPVQRLAALRPQLPPALYDDPYLEAALRKPSGVMEYWRRQAEAAESAGHFGKAYRCYYRAGWDEYASQDATLLEPLVRTAEGAGWEGLAGVARGHLASIT